MSRGSLCAPNVSVNAVDAIAANAAASAGAARRMMTWGMAPEVMQKIYAERQRRASVRRPSAPLIHRTSGSMRSYSRASTPGSRALERSRAVSVLPAVND